jgi:hypothetical protein
VVGGQVCIVNGERASCSFRDRQIKSCPVEQTKNSRARQIVERLELTPDELERLTRVLHIVRWSQPIERM